MNKYFDVCYKEAEEYIKYIVKKDDITCTEQNKLDMTMNRFVELVDDQVELYLNTKE